MAVMKSCCCCDTPTGARIIGLLYLVFTGLILTGLAVLYYRYDKVLKPFLNETTNAEAGTSASTTKTMKIISDVLIASLVLKSFYLLLCIVMLIGTFKENKGYLLPWIIVDALRQLVFFGAFVAIALVLGHLVENTMMGVESLALYCIICLIITSITFYFWLAVIGAYQRFNEEERVTPVEYEGDYPVTSSMEKFARNDSFQYE